uniref:C2H2-type domain-containing protein n=1 Tax=Knipowitschia caucasica TaxID=637954 RepID=A0AAV2LVM8_KNICA
MESIVCPVAGVGRSSVLLKEEPEEQGIKLEEDHVPVSGTDLNIVCVKTEGCDSEDSELFSDWDGDEERTASSSAAQMETDSEGDRASGLSAPETTDRGRCPFCGVVFGSEGELQRHVPLHTGERLISCTLCHKEFSKKSNLTAHMRTHTGEKPYSLKQYYVVVMQFHVVVMQFHVVVMQYHVVVMQYHVVVMQYHVVVPCETRSHRDTDTGLPGPPPGLPRSILGPSRMC